eukprot:CAMPEP_0205915506 /NCGR_PEP_ID=MMETSP1325-20131115/7920_1 /ASSEMBLY_ACC=CAM_ASM_000708 /TAXON_ID=236786 /ORGANISM="Florenciella sp., Strain RCC1007" /LENGTH=67 /DNA_ID=CAMNT_0053282695 /DNA_START=40 /DNA_END=239 /DNA_ORIENTATION=+
MKPPPSSTPRCHRCSGRRASNSDHRRARSPPSSSLSAPALVFAPKHMAGGRRPLPPPNASRGSQGLR